MGSFIGHALPGSFFYFMGLWWSTKYILKYDCKKYKRSCYFNSKSSFYRLELLEGIIIISMALIGITAEQFFPGGPYLTLYDYKEGHWKQLKMWHHCTMYFFFGLVGVTNILCHIYRSLPGSLPKLMLSNAFFVEALIFHNHTHGQDMLDIYVHQLLLLVILVTGVLIFIDFMRSNIIFALLHTSFLLFQGSWFWQIGFVLYPLNGGPAWESTDHNNMMFLTICFCWHYAVSLTVIGLNFAFVTWLVKSKLKRFCPTEVELLKNTEQEQESEEEM
ncbi:transmembrane protein 45A [Echinops telfairi]|uniref:Transmembrane protein 45A n=1 Tax=Echinops telfairi TaxID=9371 RepID=A0ABM0IS01_ECHTE|nr:transmembrane protein 45A [Echinops telfairi]